MIAAILKGLSAFARFLEACAEKEQVKTERKLTQAAALVGQANAHRKAARFARTVASSLRDINAP
jgi:hypothetical protein